MWRSKKFIIATVLVIVAVAGSIGGVVLANENGDDSETVTIFDRVAAILVDEGVNITSEQLKDAFKQAQGDIWTEALEKCLDSLVEEGKITQSEADDYLEWWESKPDVSVGFGFEGRLRFHGMRDFGCLGGLPSE